MNKFELYLWSRCLCKVTKHIQFFEFCTKKCVNNCNSVVCDNTYILEVALSITKSHDFVQNWRLDKQQKRNAFFQECYWLWNCSILIRTLLLIDRKHFKQDEAQSHNLLPGRLSAGSCALCCLLEHSEEIAVRNLASIPLTWNTGEGIIQRHILT